MNIFNGKFSIGANSYSFLAYAAQMGFGFLSFLFIVRQLTPELFGWWVIFTTFTSIAEMARSGLVQNGTIRMLKKENINREEVVTAGLLLSIIAALILSVLLLLGTWVFSQFYGDIRIQFLFVWYIPLALLMGLIRFAETLFMEAGNFKPLFINKSIYGVVFVTGIISISTLALEYLIGLQIISAVLALLSLVMSYSKLPKLGRFRKDLFTELFQYGRYVMGTNLGSMIFNKIDILLLGSLLGPVAVGFYNAASRITHIVEAPLTSVSQVLYPKIAAKFTNQDLAGIGKLYEKGIGGLLAVLLPVCAIVFCFPEWIIWCLAGDQYIEGAQILRILILAVLLKPWGRLFGITLDAIGRPQLNFHFLLVSVIVNIGLNLLFIPFWGEEGVAIATLLTIFLNTLIGQIVICRYLPIRQLNTLRQAQGVYRKLIKI